MNRIANVIKFLLSIISTLDLFYCFSIFIENWSKFKLNHLITFKT